MDNKLLIFDHKGNTHRIKDTDKFLITTPDEILRSILVTTMYFYEFHRTAEEFIEQGLLDRIGEPINLEEFDESINILKQTYIDRHGEDAFQNVEVEVNNLIAQTAEVNFGVDLKDSYQDYVEVSDDDREYRYFRFTKGEETGVVAIEVDRPNEEKVTNYFFDNDYTLTAITKEEYESESDEEISLNNK